MKNVIRVVRKQKKMNKKSKRIYEITLLSQENVLVILCWIFLFTKKFALVKLHKTLGHMEFYNLGLKCPHIYTDFTVNKVWDSKTTARNETKSHRNKNRRSG